MNIIKEVRIAKVAYSTYTASAQRAEMEFDHAVKTAKELVEKYPDVKLEVWRDNGFSIREALYVSGPENKVKAFLAEYGL